MTEWKIERCSERPEELQIIAPGLYMERKDIHEVFHEEKEGMDSYTDFECKSREITISEYELLSGIRQISTEKAIDEYTLQLIEEGVL